MKNKNGFTLVELLAVITILSIIMVITVPRIINQINGKKTTLLDTNKALIIAAARNYVLDYDLSTPITLSTQTLCDLDYIDCPIENPIDKSTMAGYVKIDSTKNYSYLDSDVTRTNTKLNDVRYIKDCINGSTANSGNHWLEINAFRDGINIASGKSVASTATPQSGKSLSLITNDSYAAVEAELLRVNENSGLQCVTVDLSKENDLDSIKVWHYYGDTRSYYSNTTYVSKDNVVWIPVIADASTETSQGKRVSAYDANTTIIPLYRVTNLAINGSFENGTTGWTVASGIDAGANSSVYGSYLLHNYHSFQYGFARQQINVIAGNKYYASIRNYTNSVGNGYCYNDMSFYYDSSDHWQGFGGNQTNIQVWEKKSQLYTIPNVTTPILAPAILVYYGTDSLQDCYADGMLLIDLTATFGAGKEPTKAWCDANLSYFDGTQSFNLSP